MAMQHPVAGIVGDEGDIDGLFRWQEHSVGPLPMRHRRPVAAEHTEAMAVEMHRMPERRVIANRQDVALSEVECHERRHAGMTVASHRMTVNGATQSLP